MPSHSPAWKQGLLLKSGSACSLSGVRAQQNQFPGLICAAGLGSCEVRDIIRVQGRTLAFGCILLVCFLWWWKGPQA